MAKVLDHITSGLPQLREIPNLVYRLDKDIIKNPAADLLDVNRLPKLAYRLLDIEMYINREVLGRPVRGMDILTSRGCPYRCAFCANTILLGQKWRPRDLGTVFEEIEELVETYGLDHLWLMDDYFFGSRKRPAAVAEHFIKKNYNLTWEANIRANDLEPERLDDGYLSLMKESGLTGLKIGAESGSDQILKMLKKDITTAQVETAVSRCQKFDFAPYLYFMNGIPGETIEEIKKTAYFMYRIKKEHPAAVLNGPGVFRPYPGGELYQRCVESGYKDPDSLREWARRDLGANYMPTKYLPWVPKPKLVDDLHWYLYKACREDRILKYRFSWHRKILGRMAEWRFDHDFWRMRVEPHVVGVVRGLRDKMQGA